MRSGPPPRPSRPAPPWSTPTSSQPWPVPAATTGGPGSPTSPVMEPHPSGTPSPAPSSTADSTGTWSLSIWSATTGAPSGSTASVVPSSPGRAARSARSRAAILLLTFSRGPAAAGTRRRLRPGPFRRPRRPDRRPDPQPLRERAIDGDQGCIRHQATGRGRWGSCSGWACSTSPWKCSARPNSSRPQARSSPGSAPPSRTPDQPPNLIAALDSGLGSFRQTLAPIRFGTAPKRRSCRQIIVAPCSPAGEVIDRYEQAATGPGDTVTGVEVLQGKLVSLRARPAGRRPDTARRVVRRRRNHLLAGSGPWLPISPDSETGPVRDQG
jgi:hypothetical protein